MKYCTQHCSNMTKTKATESDTILTHMCAHYIDQLRRSPIVSRSQVRVVLSWWCCKSGSICISRQQWKFIIWDTSTELYVWTQNYICPASLRPPRVSTWQKTEYFQFLQTDSVIYLGLPYMRTLQLLWTIDEHLLNLQYACTSPSCVLVKELLQDKAPVPVLHRCTDDYSQTQS